MSELHLLETISNRFRSGNDVPVDRAHITADEWVKLLDVLEAALEAAVTATNGLDRITEAHSSCDTSVLESIAWQTKFQLIKMGQRMYDAMQPKVTR